MPKPKWFVPLLLLVLAVAALIPAGASAALPQPAIELDAQAQNLPLGDLLTWVNQGTVKNGNVAGKFEARGTPPIVEMVAGRKAVTFNGMNGFLADFTMPAEFSGGKPWTVSYWIFNPALQPEERVFAWTRTLSTAAYPMAAYAVAVFGCGSDPARGVAWHGGAADGIGFDRGAPSTNAWHNITITYSGGTRWEKVYVDGMLNAVEQRPGSHPLNLEFGGPVYIGINDAPHCSSNFTGSIASLRVYAAEAAWAEVQTLAGAAVPPLGEAPKMINADFELGDPGAGRVFAGWAPATRWNPVAPVWTGIGAWGRNPGHSASDGPWDNGKDILGGNRVLALAGPTTVSQWLNLVGGRTYSVVVHCNAASGGQAAAAVRLGGTLLRSATILPAESAGSMQAPFDMISETFTAPADGCYELAIVQSRAGAQNVLLVADVIVTNQFFKPKRALEAAPLLAAAPALVNGDFEQPFVCPEDPWHKLAYGKARGDNQAIPGWTVAQEGIGVTRGEGPFASTLGRSGMLWIQTRAGHLPTTRTVGQRPLGWDGSKRYVIGLWVAGANHGPAGGAAGLSVRAGGQLLAARCGQGGVPLRTGLVTTITATGGRTWHHLLYDFAPTGGASGPHQLEISAIALGGEKVLLIDNVKIYEAGSPPAGSCPQFAAGPLRFVGTQTLQSLPTTVTIFNEGGTTMSLGGFEIIGANKPQFKTEKLTYQVPPFGGSCNHPVVMQSKDIGGIDRAALQFYCEDTTGTRQLPLYGTAVNYPVFSNGSFELPVIYWANDGTWPVHGGGVPGRLPGWQFWTPPGAADASEYFGVSIPIDPEFVDTPWNNGAQQFGTQAAWLRVGPENSADPALRTPKALRQRIYGFMAGMQYNLHLYINARAIGGDHLVDWKMRYGRDENSLVDLIPARDLAAVALPGNFTKPYRKFEVTFTTTTGGNMRSDGSMLFEIYVPNQPDDSTLLIDMIDFQYSGCWGSAYRTWSKYQ